MLKYNHFPPRWLDMLDAMIEKGKLNETSKLKVAQATEAYLQLLMKTFSRIRAEANCENDTRVSKNNCCSRKVHSTDSESLEKDDFF